MSGIFEIARKFADCVKLHSEFFDTFCVCVFFLNRFNVLLQIHILCDCVYVCAKTQNCAHSRLMLPKCLIPLCSDEGGVFGNGVYAVYGSAKCDDGLFVLFILFGLVLLLLLLL